MADGARPHRRTKILPRDGSGGAQKRPQGRSPAHSIVALWTEDGVFVASNGVTYSGKGKPGTPSCDLGALTLCDLYAQHAGGLVLGHDWVSLTPIFTEVATVLDHENGELYFQCIYLDAILPRPTGMDGGS